MINNHVGSVIGTYDLNGTQQEGEDYYPFGDSSHHWNGNKQQRFAGKIRLSWTGYYDFGARQYIPWLAKFTSVDPLAAKSTDRNPYHYASNNPINRTDPTGMSDGKGDGKGDVKGGDANLSGNAQKANGATAGQKIDVAGIDSKTLIDPGGNIITVDKNTIATDDNNILTNSEGKSSIYNHDLKSYVDTETAMVAEQSPVVSGLVPSESDLASSSEPKSFFEKLDQAFYKAQGSDSGEMSFERGQKIMGGTVSVFLGVASLGTATGIQALVGSAVSILFGLDDIGSNYNGESFVESNLDSEVLKGVYNASKTSYSFISGKKSMLDVMKAGGFSKGREGFEQAGELAESYSSTIQGMISTGHNIKNSSQDSLRRK